MIVLLTSRYCSVWTRFATPHKYQGSLSYKQDESKSWEERYKALEVHHIQETTFLIDKVRELAAEVDRLRV